MSYIDEWYRKILERQRQAQSTRTFKLPEGFEVKVDPSLEPNEIRWTTSDSSQNYGWWNDDWKPEEKKCDHKWKKVEGINKYYVVCEICDERNKEEEERINAK